TTSFNFSLPNTLSSLYFSELIGLPESGNTACVALSLPCFAEPPAESPSTIYSSQSAGFLLEQSANLPGKVPPSRAPLRITASLAALAARLAFRDRIARDSTDLASSGCSYSLDFIAVLITF